MTDPEAEFVAYVNARRGALLRSAMLITGDPHTAQDLLQDALIKLAARWERVGEGSPDAYVRRIMFHDNISRWRRTRREVPVREIAESARPLGGSEPVDPARVVTGLDVRRALGELTDKQRAVLVLRYYDDLSETQIAQTLGVSNGTVKSQAHAALKRLRELLPEAAEALVRSEERP
ncbi:SigE family RNA polymerase sigma factor [Ornithinimicrobium cryptoxanthini]|uniref:SigE family RNA polymerase sigma factor n=1 Tax=Ornithinimicrobium cryptoxanthini TaxID=2934161 RepID=A0ABY4YIN4_9MICO|nr:SigE family RNA polymerase sigma factor [Ornithinimicrobium cryptoxanthini]USQ76621.1 SigE family RNA polymerase sigma factor [Ornithinimicrobium cryptoxanthini]